jgi:hypothetical protein
MILCSSCQQHLRAEGEMAERSYDLQDAKHMGGAIRALLVAFGVAVVRAILEVATGHIYGALAIFAGLIVARVYRSAAGCVDTSAITRPGARSWSAISSPSRLRCGGITQWRTSHSQAMALYARVATTSAGQARAADLVWLAGRRCPRHTSQRFSFRTATQPSGSF